MSKPWFEEVIKISINKLEKLDVFEIKNIEYVLKEIASLNITSKKNVFQSIRGAVLGKLVTPGLYESIEVLGKEETIKRLKRTLNFSNNITKLNK